MAALPTGTVTFFFSDIVGSTRLLEALGPDYPDLLERHREIARDAFSRCAAVEIGTEGDSFFAVFPAATDAVAAAVAIQRAVAAEQWPRAATLRLRIGLHTGEARVSGEGYVGMDVHRAARIMSAAHGGQILVSHATRALVERSAGNGIELRDLGQHRLRDLATREHVFQVLAPGLEADFPALRSLDATPNNLPTQTSELIGRDAELAAIRRHLDTASVRLLTLTGPGGIGKTRLALQAAASQVEAYTDGIFFVDLSAARDADAALQAIVRAMAVPVSGNDRVRDALAEELHTRRLLLLLDNFEQVMAAADDVAELLARCPQLKLLVTSREALRVRGERLFPVAPLSLPDAGQPLATATDVSRFEAVRLFVERAREARPSFELTDENAAAVAEVCARLDGLPLAIELAAASLKLFSPMELKDRLRSRLEPLRGGARDLPARQQTLRGTIEWSYALLDLDERLVIQLFSVFSSARVAAVEEVAARLAPLAGVDVLDRLSSLIDKSLVRSAEDTAAQRLSMLGTIREFAAEQLEAEPTLAPAARRAHAEYFAEFAQSRRGAPHGERETAIDELASELGNLQAAWGYFLGAADIGQLNKLVDPLWALHEARGWYHGAVALMNDLLDVLSQAAATPDRAEEEMTLRMSLARGLLALRGYTQEVEDVYRAALALAESSGTAPKQFSVLRSLANYHLYRGEVDKTAAIGRQVLDLAGEEQDATLEVEGHLIAGPAIAFLGDVASGLDHLDRALALFDPRRHRPARFRLGPSPGVAAGAVSALFHWWAGNPDTADRRAATALDLAAELHHPYSLAYASFHVAVLDLWSRHLEPAHELASNVLRVADEHDYAIWRALGFVVQGVAVAKLGRADDGLALTEQGIALYEGLRTPPVFWPLVLAFRADACALAGRPADALSLIDQAAAIAGADNWLSASFMIQKGDLLLAIGDAGGADVSLRRAFEEARRLRARMLLLQAATRIARVAEPARTHDALAALRDVVGTFSEGLDGPDLLEARAVLDEAIAGGS